MQGRVENKVAIVTGAARGTGLAISRRLAEEGATVWMCDIRADALEQAAQKLSADGHAVSLAELDVCDEQGWSGLVDQVLARHGRVDVLVNNAALLHIARLSETEAADFERLHRVNVIGPFLGIKAVLAPMRAQGGGSIVNIASIDALTTHNGVIAYTATKFGLRGLSKTAAVELGPLGIRVNTVCPSGGSFDMIVPFLDQIDAEASVAAPSRSLIPDNADPRQDMVEFAEMVVFLASDAAAGCTGGDYPVDRGQTAGHVIAGMPIEAV